MLTGGDNLQTPVLAMADTSEQDVLRSPHSAALMLAPSLRAGNAVPKPKLVVVGVGGGGEWGRSVFWRGAGGRDSKRFLEGV